MNEEKVGQVVLGVWVVGTVGCLAAALMGAIVDPYAWWPMQLLTASGISFTVVATLRIVCSVITAVGEKSSSTKVGDQDA